MTRSTNTAIQLINKCYNSLSQAQADMKDLLEWAEQHPDAPLSFHSPEKPSITTHIKAIMEQERGPWSARDVYEELNRQGVAPKARKAVQAVRVSLSRMAKSGDPWIVKIGDGLYVHKEFVDTQTARKVS
jgi:hypothetical protein